MPLPRCCSHLGVCALAALFAVAPAIRTNVAQTGQAIEQAETEAWVVHQHPEGMRFPQYSNEISRVPSGYNLNPNHLSSRMKECMWHTTSTSVDSEKLRRIVTEWYMTFASNGHWGIIAKLEQPAGSPEKPVAWVIVHRVMDFDFDSKEGLGPCNHAEIQIFDSFDTAAVQVTMGKKYTRLNNEVQTKQTLAELLAVAHAAITAEEAPFDFWADNCRDFVREVMSTMGWRSKLMMMAKDTLVKWWMFGEHAKLRPKTMEDWMGGHGLRFSDDDGTDDAGLNGLPGTDAHGLNGLPGTDSTDDDSDAGSDRVGKAHWVVPVLPKGGRAPEAS